MRTLAILAALCAATSAQAQAVLGTEAGCAHVAGDETVPEDRFAILPGHLAYRGATCQIAGIQTETGEAVTAIQGIARTIGEVNDIAASIAAAVEQQGAATQEISRNVQEAADGPQPLRVLCECPGAPRTLNLTLTLRLREHTSPVLTFVRECGPAGRE